MADRSLSRGWLLGVVNLAAVLGLFFAVPVRTDSSGLRLSLGVLGAAAAVAVVGWVVAQEVRREAAGRGREVRFLHLWLLLEVVMTLFALTYYALAVNMEGEFAEMHTRLDALYFTASTMTTVGFGDVHAVGQVARGIVTVHMVFDVVFIAALAGLASRRLPGLGAAD